MTTIAWDGKTLASDRLSSASAYKASVRKISRTPEGALVGVCGATDACQITLDWAVSGSAGDPPLPAGGEAIDEVIVVEPDGTVFLRGIHGRYAIRDRKWAIGSGRCYALAAMACGKTAAEAVRLASRFDPFTGHAVDVLALRG